MADVIARAVVEVLPDTRRFTSQLTRELRAATRTLTRDLRRITRRLRQVRTFTNLSVGSIRRMATEIGKVNVALRLTVLGFLTLTGKSIVGGFLAIGGAIAEASGALLILPAAGAAAAITFGALAVGLFGVSDVLKDFADPEKFSKGLKELSKNARETLGVLNEFRPRLVAFRNAVQDALFANLAPVARDLGRTFLPLLERGFTAIAREANLAARELAAFALRRDSIQDVDRTVQNTTRSVHVLRPAVAALAEVFRDVTVVGSRFLPLIAAGLTSLAVGLRNFVAEARTTGRLEDFIARGLAAVRTTLDILINLGLFVGSVMRAAREAGASLLDTLERITGRMADFAAGAEGQARIALLIANAAAAFQALAPVLQAVGRLLGEHVLPLFARFATIVGPSVVIFLDAIGRAIDVARPGIEAFATGFGRFLEALAPALPAIGRFVGVLGEGLGRVLEEIGPPFAEFITLVADELAAAVPELVPAIIELGKAFLEILKAVIPLLPVITDLAVIALTLLADILKILEPLIEPLVGLLEALIPLFRNLIPVIVVLLTPLALLATVLLKLSEAFATLITAPGEVVDAFTNMFLEITGLEKLFLERTIGNLGEVVRRHQTAGADAGQAFGTGLASSGAQTVGTARILWENILNVLNDKEPIGAAGQGLGLAFGNGIGAVRGTVAAQAGVLWENVFDILKRREPFGVAGSGIGAAFGGGIAGAGGAALDAATRIWQGVLGIFGQSGFAVGAGSAIGHGFAAGIRSAAGAVGSAAAGLVAAAGRYLPRSPAELGPFSGRGWTPFRGLALAEGLAEGIAAGRGLVQSAAARLAASTALGLGTPARVAGVGPVPTTTAAVIARRRDGSATPSPPAVSVRVFLGTRELTDVVRVEIDESRRAERRALVAGVGGAR